MNLEAARYNRVGLVFTAGSMANFGTRVYTFFHGEQVGSDEFGNRYYRAKAKGIQIGRVHTERRWVLFKGAPEPTKVPPYWHGWLHHITDNVPTDADKERLYRWQKGHLPNLTGTELAYRPPGHITQGAQRAKATGDYEPWIPS